MFAIRLKEYVLILLAIAPRCKVTFQYFDAFQHSVERVLQPRACNLARPKPRAGTSDLEGAVPRILSRPAPPPRDRSGHADSRRPRVRCASCRLDARRPGPPTPAPPTSPERRHGTRPPGGPRRRRPRSPRRNRPRAPSRPAALSRRPQAGIAAVPARPCPRHHRAGAPRTRAGGTRLRLDRA